MSNHALRVLPQLDDLNTPFWTGGAEGSLLIQQCPSCELYMHPPRPLCNQCRNTALVYPAVSGKGKIKSFTINHQPWLPGLATPYCVAVIELKEQKDLQLLSNVYATDLDSIHIGSEVSVSFHNQEDVWIPVFYI